MTSAATRPAIEAGPGLGGKDRTGLTVALLLTALGVPRQAVLDDYELTSDYRGVAHSSGVVALFVQEGMTRPAAEGLLGAPWWVMARALGGLDDTCDGIEGYLLGPGGMRRDLVSAGGGSGRISGRSAACRLLRGCCRGPG